MKSKLLIAVAGVTLLGIAQASAAIVDVTYTGTVSYGSDPTGVFGTVETGGKAYVGDPFVANFVFNTNIYTEAYSSPTLNYAIGEQGFGDSPALSASLTLNGQTASIGNPSYAGEIYGSNDGCCDSEQLHSSQYFFSDISIVVYNYLDAAIYANDASIPASITTPFTYNVAWDPNAYKIHGLYGL